MPDRPDLKIVHDSETPDPVPQPVELPRHDFAQTALGFAYSIPMWCILGWIVWMWWTGRY